MSVISEFIAGRTPPELYQSYLSGLFEPWADELIGQNPPQGRVLDVGCGTGIVSRALARAAGVEEVIGIDIAPPMIEMAKGLTSSEIVDFQVSSAESLPFEDSVFDAAFCQQALQFVPNKVQALNEMFRVLKPGHRMALACWTAVEDGNPVFAAMAELIGRELGQDLLPLAPFAFGSAERLQSLAEESMLKPISIERRELEIVWPSPRTLMLFDLLFMGRPGPDGNMQPLFDVSDDSLDPQIEAMIAEYETMLADYRQPDGSMRAPIAANILIAEAVK